MATVEIDKKEAGNGKQEFKIIGQRVVRPDGVDKVTGRAQYGADVKPAGLLYGKVLRSPHAHARIVSIDTSAAAKLPGVKAVVTGKDLHAGGRQDGKERRGRDQLQLPQPEPDGAGQGAVSRPCHRSCGRHQHPHRRRSRGADQG